MKKLTNTSPFLLLLAPVFIMIAVTFAVNFNQADDDDVAIKPTKITLNIIKQASVIFN